MTLTTSPIPTTSRPPAGRPPAGPEPRSRRGGFIALVALIAIAALAAGLFLGRSGGSSSSVSPAGGGPATTAAAGEDQASGSGQSAPQDVAPQPQPEPQPHPQPQPKPQPGVLSVGPSVTELASNDWTAEFTVSNVGGSDMSWFAVGVPSNVGLSATKGTLAAGEETTVTATVDHTTLAKGDFSLTLHVSANDTASAVTIKGTKEIKVNVPPGPGDLKPKS